MKLSTKVQELIENLFINDIYEINNTLSIKETQQLNFFLCSLEEKLDFITNNTKIKSNDTNDLYLLEKYRSRHPSVDVVKPNESNEQEKGRIKKILKSGDSNHLISQLEDYYNNIDSTQKQDILISSINKYIVTATDVNSNEKHDSDFINKLEELKKKTEDFSFQPRLY